MSATAKAFPPRQQEWRRHDRYRCYRLRLLGAEPRALRCRDGRLPPCWHRRFLGRGASIGSNATIICGTTVGRFALVGAGAVVTRDVPDYAIVAGVPAKVVGDVRDREDLLTLAKEMATR